MPRPYLIALISLVVVLITTAVPQAASAEGLEEGLTVIAVDQGAAPAAGDLEVAETALLTVASSINEGGVDLLVYGMEPGIFTLLRPGADTMLAVRNVVAELNQSVGPYYSDQFAAISAAYARMTRLNAPRGSRLVIITPGRIDGESEPAGARLKGLGELFGRDGWQIEMMTLPSTGAPRREILAGAAYASGGAHYDLGSADGLSAMLRDWMGLKLMPAIDAELSRGASSLAPVEVAPHTASLRVAFIRAASQTGVQLYRPNGAPAEINLPGNSVFETPNAVVYTITNPEAGAWRLHGAGAGSKLVAGAEVKNPLDLQLVAEPPFPVGAETVLRAAALIGGLPQPLAGATVVARVNHADGSAAVYEMNDAGAGADSVAGDGIFSALLPPAARQGFNDVALDLRWAAYGATLRSSGVFRTEFFPAVLVTEVTDIETLRGDSATVAKVRVMAGPYPHLVRPEDFTARLVGENGVTEASVVAAAVVENGKAWEFEVRAAPPSSGEYRVAVTLASEHLGRTFESVAPTISASAMVSPRPLTLLKLQIWAWAIIVLAVAAAAAVAVYLLKQVRPYGFLYDDSNHVVVDFARVSGNPLRRVLARNHVPARAVPGLPFHGGEFTFTKDSVELRYQHETGDPSLRVNSRPAASTIIRLGEDVWLGVGGRLLRFMKQRRSALTAEPAVGDGGS